MDNYHVGTVPLIEIELPGGARGLQGIQGPKGKDGREFHAQVGNTTTLPPGSDATVSINEDETSDTVYYNFGIPRGYKGDKGDKGETGEMLFTTFDVVNGKLIAYYSQENRSYNFQLNGNKLEVVLDE